VLKLPAVPRDRPEFRLAAAVWRADRPLAALWWTLLLARGLLPAAFAVVMGVLVGAVQHGRPLAVALAAVGVVFVLTQVMAPVHLALSANLGDRTAAWLYDRLTEACVTPPGLGHLEDPELARDMTVARDFDLGMTGPPLAVSLDFVAGGLVAMVAGLASVTLLFGYAWWAPLVLGGAWLATHWLLRESGVWKDRNTDEVRSAQQEAEYAYRLAVDAPPAKEVRLFGLADWVLGRFTDRRVRLHELQYRATRMRERSVVLSLALVFAANGLVFWLLVADAVAGRLDLGATVIFAQAALGASAIAFGGLNWSLDSAAAPAAAVFRLGRRTGPAGHLSAGERPAAGLPGREIRFRGVSFHYPGTDTPVLREFDLTIPAGTSLAIVGRNGAGKTTLAKLLCRLYDPDAGSIEVDGVDLRTLDIDSWRSRVTAVFQDFIRFELPLRDNVAPTGAPDDVVEAALAAAGAAGLTTVDTVLAKGYPGGTDLSGGQWQRVALARAIAAVRQGAGLVLLDEPTAQLDVRGEAEIFERVLAETRGRTTILVSHRFSTVRQADRICVLEQGRVVELGSHDELMALGGRYREMFDLQAQRFAAGLAADAEDAEVTYDVLT
jgi:ABC-type multidrug transport system fused ATPase/permease subunit